MNDRSAKSFSISCARTSLDRAALVALVALVALCLAAAPAEAKRKKKPTAVEDLFNPLLGPDYSHWLVGPVARMATHEEIEEYLNLILDEEAEAFIAEFWQRRNEGTDFFAETPEEIFEKRAVEADKRFSEAAYPGRRTDRGTIHVLFGEPEKIEYEASDRKIGAPTVEVWRYPEDAEPGLTGEPPERAYRFLEVEGQTVFYDSSAVRRREIEDRRNRRREPRFPDGRYPDGPGGRFP